MLNVFFMCLICHPYIFSGQVSVQSLPIFKLSCFIVEF